MAELPQSIPYPGAIVKCYGLFQAVPVRPALRAAPPPLGGERRPGAGEARRRTHRGVPRWGGLLLGCLLLALSPGLLRAVDLVEVYQLAAQHDALFKAALAAYHADRENYALQRAPLLPQLEAGASYQEQKRKEKSSQTFVFGEMLLPTTSSDDPEENQEEYFLSLRQRIIDVPAWLDFRRGQELRNQAEAELQVARQELLLRVLQAYFEVLRARSFLGSAEAEEAALRRQWERAQERFAVGLVAITDVYEARAAYDTVRANRLEQESALGTAYEQLRVITGRDHRDLEDLGDGYPIEGAQPADRDAWVQRALEQSPRLRASRFAAEAAHKNAAARRAAHLPTLSAQFRYSDRETDGTSQGNPLDRSGEVDNVRLDLSIPLYSGGALSASRRQAHHRYVQAQETHNNTQRDLVHRVRSLYLTVDTNTARVTARRQALRSSLSALESVQAGYDVGNRNVVDVLNAQRDVFRALRDQDNARYDYVLDLFRLYQESGALRPEQLEDLNQWLSPRDEGLPQDVPPEEEGGE